MQRCGWVNLKNPIYVAYHDSEWGIPCHDDRVLFELLILEGFQAGLSWECVLNKRQNFRKAYDNFDVNRVAQYDSHKIDELLANPGIIRNRKKITASINNSKVFLKIQSEFGGFNHYIWSFTGGISVIESYLEHTTSSLSDTISKDLRHRGMRYVGSIIIYSYLQAIGVISGHAADCDCYILKANRTPHRDAGQ